MANGRGTIQDKLKLRLTGIRLRSRSCKVADGVFACAANGNLFPCTRFITSKSDAPYIMGNVFDSAAMLTNARARHFILQARFTEFPRRFVLMNACWLLFAMMR